MRRVSLITYADRLAGDLKKLKDLLDGELSGLFGGVHILPFFNPIDGADAGFDPTDHLAVDQQLGAWDDVSAIATEHAVMADMIVNHVSSESSQFQDVLLNGTASRFWGLFLRYGDAFGSLDPDAADAKVQQIYRPRPGVPFTARTLADGSTHEFWTTFSSSQLDINVESAPGQEYLQSILETFSAAGVKEVRLDAAGYAIKRPGTDCFMLPETYDFIAALGAEAHTLGMETLVEIHGHYQVQCEIAERVGRVYDFALPPLVLHSLYTNDVSALEHWLRIAPRNCVTVLDTHDGIGIVDVGAAGDRPGLLSDHEIDSLVEGIHHRTAGKSRRASGNTASNLDIYQVNSTYYDALGGSDIDYLIARAIQFFAPGTPQVYYVGLLAGENDLGLVERTGVGRDINRHYYSREELLSAINRPVVEELFALIRLCNSLPVFEGDFCVESSPEQHLVLSWTHGERSARLAVDFAQRRATIAGVLDGEPFEYTIGALTEASREAV
ncbi:sucrose phosphorylase [Congregibacter litoralis]|uniref:Sucrose phosphorylase n=1 Tax=Congregibacter litoralis KT71 TaxID=314285 RepID=A4AAW3_9GAMM|nr:sucrose phosphorylase [Congregibacter litoralis]EAQ96835.1 sucrose phosphorylase [Congregibacter litoralis KT71]